MSLIGFELLLKDTIGLDVASVGSSAIDRAVSERLRVLRMNEEASYLELVRASESELQALIEAVIVPETWFFRDVDPFRALGRLVIEERLRPSNGTVLNLLSVPCSTGEEPYSIAMALLDASVSPALFRIDAVDISERALTHARRACYGLGSFRGTDLTFRDRYFDRTPGGWLLSGAVCQPVHFQQGNLLSPSFKADSDGYDAIFCRNLMIYFDGSTQERAIDVLTRLLAPRGVLFVGASETGAFLSRDFQPLKLPMTFAFQRERLATSPMPHVVEPLLARTFAAQPAPRSQRMPAGVPKPVPAKVLSESSATTEQRNGLSEARRFADEGNFAEAAQRCEEHIRRHGPSAEAFYLLGLVRDACGNHLDADIHYRKTLYLEPEHFEALAHLALLMDKQHRVADAEVLRNRIRRLESRQKAAT